MYPSLNKCRQMCHWMSHNRHRFVHIGTDVLNVATPTVWRQGLFVCPCSTRHSKQCFCVLFCDVSRKIVSFLFNCLSVSVCLSVYFSVRPIFVDSHGRSRCAPAASSFELDNISCSLFVLCFCLFV